MYELGFLANALFACSSLLFSSCSVAALISIVISNGNIARWIRYPQLLSGSGFFAASTMLMFETQKGWWKPAVKTLGWYISLMNMFGSAGFMFCALFGIVEDNHWTKYQFGLSFLWGESSSVSPNSYGNFVLTFAQALGRSCLEALCSGTRHWTNTR